MTYNWKEIFKSKSDLELYKIHIGETILNNEAKEFAEEELKSRDFDFNNLEKHKRKWELERLIEEDRYESKNYYLGISNSMQYLILSIGSAVFITTILIAYILDFNFLM